MFVTLFPLGCACFADAILCARIDVCFWMFWMVCLLFCLLLMLCVWLSRGEKEGGEEGDWFGTSKSQGWEFWGVVFWGLFCLFQCCFMASIKCALHVWLRTISSSHYSLCQTTVILSFYHVLCMCLRCQWPLGQVAREVLVLGLWSVWVTCWFKSNEGLISLTKRFKISP